jgi:lysophospholipase L1-like esterase
MAVQLFQISSAIKTLTYASSINWDASNPDISITLTGNATLNNPTNLIVGATYTLYLYQDSVGNRTLSFGSIFNGFSPVLSTSANAVDIFTFKYDGTYLYGDRRTTTPPVIYGTSTPSNSSGTNGDLFINTSTGGFYFKVAGVWALVFTSGSGSGGKTTPTLPSSITLYCDLAFSASSKLTTNSSNQVIAVAASGGSNPFTLIQSNAGGVNNYPASYGALTSGNTYISNGGLNSQTAFTSFPGYPSLSNFTIVMTFFRGYTINSSTLLSNSTIQPLGGVINSNATYQLTLVNGWSTNQGIGIAGPINYTSRNCVEDLNVHTLIVICSSNNLSFYVDGVFAGSTTSTYGLTSPGWAQNILLSSGASATSSTDLNVLRTSFFAGAPNLTDIASIDNYYQYLYSNDYKSSALLAKPLWIFNGNSIFQGFYYGNMNTPSVQTVSRLKATYGKIINRWYNVSQGGTTTTQMLIDAPKYTDPYIAQQGTTTVNIVLHEGTNDILNGSTTGITTGAQAYANLKAYMLARKAAANSGQTVNVFVCTILPRTSFTSAQSSAALACNALIRSNAVSDGFAGYVDFDNNFNPSTANANLSIPTNTTYYLDGTHPTLTGATQMSITMAAALNSFV